MLISENRYRPLNIITIVLIFSFFVGCGLPETQALLKPSRVEQARGSLLAFETPADTSEIQGYTLYYKVYYSQTDFVDEVDDTYWFNEGTYINFEDEMQPGPYIPNQRGYIRMGELGGVSTDLYPGFLISDPGDSVVVYIDFDWELKRGTFDDTSKDPIVTLNPLPVTPAVLLTLARGIYDPTDSNNSLRRFVNDWDYDDGSPNDSYHDADLRRKYNMPFSSSISAITSFMISGDPIVDALTPR